jgi:hypothetical protein
VPDLSLQFSREVRKEVERKRWSHCVKVERYLSALNFAFVRMLNLKKLDFASVCGNKSERTSSSYLRGRGRYKVIAGAGSNEASTITSLI